MTGHIIAVVGGKGGVGKSVFAANLALAHLTEFKQRPLIVDLDLNSLGDQNIILGQNPPKRREQAYLFFSGSKLARLNGMQHKFAGLPEGNGAHIPYFSERHIETLRLLP